MKTLAVIAGIMLTLTAQAGTAFFKYEINDGGLTKVCIYDYIGNTHSLTVKSYQICPITIQV